MLNKCIRNLRFQRIYMHNQRSSFNFALYLGLFFWRQHFLIFSIFHNTFNYSLWMFFPLALLSLITCSSISRLFCFRSNLQYLSTMLPVLALVYYSFTNNHRHLNTLCSQWGWWYGQSCSSGPCLIQSVLLKTGSFLNVNSQSGNKDHPCWWS